MEKGLYVALSGAVAQERALDQVAHSVANASTPGFRAPRITFQEALKREEDKNAPQVAVASIVPDASAGPIRATGRALDVALDGDGYFTVATPNGVRYTRAGNFRIGEGGVLLTGGGDRVLDRQGSPIEVPGGEGELTISPHGVVYAGAQEIAALNIVSIDPTSLEHEGQLLRATGETRDSEAKLVSGSLEGSNLNVVRGMVDLVRVQRTYEALARMIENYKQIDQRTARDVGSVV